MKIQSLETDCWLSTYMENTRQVGSSPRIHISVHLQCYLREQLKLQRACSPQTKPQPPRTVDTFTKPSVDGEHFLHVHSSHLLPRLSSSSIQIGYLWPFKGLPKPSALNCLGLLLSPCPAPLTIRFQVTSGTRDYTGAS